MDWGQKLQTKLSALSDSASKDSLQALAKWIGFNRKHSAPFCDTFLTALSSNVPQQVHYLTCISLVCLLEHGNSKKWDRLNDLRIALAEKVILPSISLLQEPAREALTSILKEWDEANSLGGPTVINQIRKKLNQQGETPTIENVHKADAAEQGTAAAAPDAETAVDVEPAVDLAVSPRRLSLSQMDATTIEYDFEGTGEEAKEVKPKEFLEPCRTIANLSIVRDMRNDSALQLSSQLSSLPEDIRKVCAESAKGENIELEDATARDFSKRMNPALLDMDIQEQLNNIRDFRKVVLQTRMARKSLITLLQQSRCNFGASEAAEAFLGADSATSELKERQQIIVDAMELEGVEPPELKEIQAKELAPLTWHQPSNKRQKTD